MELPGKVVRILVHLDISLPIRMTMESLAWQEVETVKGILRMICSCYFHIILVITVTKLYKNKNYVCTYSERETATTALMEGGGPRGPGRGPSGNGFFNNNCSTLAAAAHAAAHNGGDRSRLFRKSNGSKPVREWYV